VLIIISTQKGLVINLISFDTVWIQANRFWQL